LTGNHEREYDQQCRRIGRSTRAGDADATRVYYGGSWHDPAGGYRPTFIPATGQILAQAPQANALDVDRAVLSAPQGFLAWSKVAAADKSAKLHEIARRLR